MKNVYNESKPLTSQQKQIEATLNQLREVIYIIIKDFVKVMSTNKLLGLECLFRYKSKELIQSIIGNYSELESGKNLEKLIDEEEDDFNNEEDEILKEYKQGIDHDMVKIQKLKAAANNSWT